ncbi:uncharacterized protein LOC122794821 [Protopterus annectens]|uniref:uncharacterized protein LOC122794821 n=1 Tax=Protopterus annectens TaxID=7888 RepID=UPI001CFC3964|nr:uncharacterized protein LOC122794821 [Protopterus annectens]
MTSEKEELNKELNNLNNMFMERGYLKEKVDRVIDEIKRGWGTRYKPLLGVPNGVHDKYGEENCNNKNKKYQKACIIEFNGFTEIFTDTVRKNWSMLKINKELFEVVGFEPTFTYRTGMNFKRVFEQTHKKKLGVLRVTTNCGHCVAMKACVSSVLKAVEDFAVKHPTSSVSCVKLISTTSEIFTAFQEEASTKSQKSGSIWSTILSFFGGASSLSQDNETSSEDDIAPAILKMYALKKESILKAFDDIQLLLTKECISKDLEIELDMFSNENLELIKQFSSDVEVNFNKEKSTICISGFTSQICELQDKIITLSRTLQQNRTTEQEAKHLQEKVCWKFWKDGKWMDFNFKVNACLERAYQINDKEADVEVDGVYVLFNMENKMLKLNNTDIRICRRNPAGKNS